MICLVAAVFAFVTLHESKPKEDQETVINSIETTEINTVAGSDTASVQTSGEKANPIMEPVTDESALKEQGYESIKDYFREKDPYWNDSDEYQAAVSAYERSVGKDFVNKLLEEKGGIGEPNFAYAYIDEDNIPELLLGFGNFHTSGIYVLQYDPEKNDVNIIGEFSSFGGVKYVDHGNRIISQYGSYDLYMIIVSKIDDGKAHAVGAVTEDADGGSYPNPDENSEVWLIAPGFYYYAGYSLPEGADGSHKDSYSDLSEGTGPDPVHVDFPDEEYVVSEEEYNRIYSEMLGGEESIDKVISVRYEGDPDSDEVVLEKIEYKR